jgi:peptide/nickel transport system substrate-binding protein
LTKPAIPIPTPPAPSRLRLTLKVSTNEFYRLQAAVIQQDLRNVGIDLDVRSHEFATLAQDVARGNFQLATLQWGRHFGS